MSQNQHRRLSVGKWTAIPDANELRHPSGRRRRLEARAMDVLVLMHERAGEVVSTDEMLERIWDGRPVSSHSVAIVVSDLRRVLGDDARAPRYIETVPKRGYRFIAGTRPGPLRGHRRRAVRSAAVAVLLAAVLSLGWVALDRGRTPSARAQQAELEQLFLARQLWNRRDYDGVLEAISILNRLLETNPRSAAAHAALAMIYAHKSGEHLGMPALDTFRQAQRHLDRARTNGAERADVWVAQALLDFYRDHQPLKAEAALERAVALDAGSALAWQTRAMVASALGHHDESLGAIARAADLDPVSAGIAWDRVWFLYLAGRTEEAREAIDRATATGGRSFLYEALIADQSGQDARALALWLERIADRGLELAAPHQVLDRAAESATAAYAELVRQTAALPPDHDSPGVRAFWRLKAGDERAAAAILVRAPPSRDHWMVLWLNEIPAFAVLRQRPEIGELIARSGLAPTPPPSPTD